MFAYLCTSLFKELAGQFFVCTIRLLPRAYSEILENNLDVG